MRLRNGHCLSLLLLAIATKVASVIVDNNNNNGNVLSPSSSALSNNETISADSLKEAYELYTKGTNILENKQASVADLKEAITLLQVSAQLGHGMATFELSRLFFFGRANLEPDYDQCAHHLEQCTEAECHFLTGLFHENGLGGKRRSISHALTYYSLAAERKNTAASIAMGWAYSTGTKVAKSCTKSRDNYFHVAKEMAKEIEEKRIRIFPKQARIFLDKTQEKVEAGQTTQDIVDFYNYNANTNDASSMLFLGQVYYLGIGGIEKDLNLAREYFKKASTLGNSIADGYLGQMDFYAEGIEEPNYRRAYHQFRKAAKDKVASGLNGMGLLYWKGIEVVADTEEAINYFKQAVELESAEAGYNLAKVLSEVDPVANEDKIFSGYLNSLRGGFVLAGFELAKLNMNKDLTCGLAKFLLENVLEKHPSLYLLDEGVELYNRGKHGAALSRFLYFAAQGYEAARFNAAFLLEEIAKKRKGNERNSYFRRALVLWSLCADQGDTYSLLKTGDYFYYGWGVSKPSPMTAAAYYHKAIEKKSGQAAFNLAYLHQHGIGVAKDFYMASKYYQQSIVLAKGEDKSEAWLPVHFALSFLTISQHIDKLKSRIWSLPQWSVAIATLIILLTVLLVSAVIRMGRLMASIRTPRMPAEQQPFLHQANNNNDDDDDDGDE